MDSVPKNEREKALNYISTLLEVAREPFLILDKSLMVISASDSFFKTFKVTRKEKQKESLYII